MTADPAQDQAEARLRDMRRLRDMLTAYRSGEPTTGVIDCMTPVDRVEAGAITARLADLWEPPGIAAARRDMLLRLADMEVGLREIAAQDPSLSRCVAAELHKLDRFRARLTGLPPRGSP